MARDLATREIKAGDPSEPRNVSAALRSIFSEELKINVPAAPQTGTLDLEKAK